MYKQKLFVNLFHKKSFASYVMIYDQSQTEFSFTTVANANLLKLRHPLVTSECKKNIYREKMYTSLVL